MKIQSSFNKLLLLSLSMTVIGCGSIQKINPFSEDKPEARQEIYKNATTYECEGGKKFYVRIIENGSAAWLILPEREVSLPKTTAASGTRYSNGISVLDLEGNEAKLQDGPSRSFTGCKAVSPKK